jgi:tRNA threonylcarbamoyladenosine biosynthesis protein TsaB
MALILNIETSTEVCSVSLAENGQLLFKKESIDGMNHSRLLTVFIEEIFVENNILINTIDAVAVSKGPGSYTGLRIGVSVAKGLCYGLEYSVNFNQFS